MHITREHWQRIRSLFHAALDRPAEQRPAFVRAAADDDPAVAAEVDRLLQAHAAGGEFLNPPAAESVFGAAEAAASGVRGADAGVPVAAADPDAPGTWIGRYRLVRLIGEGGFGLVYLAEQHEPIRRQVALKVLKLGMDTRDVVARFELERQTLALMDHPNLARVFDAGATPRGRPYFVMEYVPGLPITQYCDEQRLSIDARLALLIQVCDAIQHAHQKGAVHRDIKPGNVLVESRDGRALPKVIDFGLAKAIGGGLTDRSTFTQRGQFVGTPEYASPEQAGLTGQDVDTRTDVYALGVLLYELLTGTVPLDLRTLRPGTPAQIERVIREVDPPRPSTRLSRLADARASAAAARGVEPEPADPRDAGDAPSQTTLAQIAHRRRTTPGALRRRIRGDLDWIALKALAKDRARRYGAASDLAADIRRHLADEPVSAGPPRATYRVAKFVRRNRGVVAASLGVAASLVAGILATTLMYLRAEAARDRAVDARRSAEMRLHRAWQSIADMQEFAEMRLANLAGGSAAREFLARTALEHMTKLMAETELDPREKSPIAGSLAYVHQRVGEAQLVLGRTADALASFRASLEIRRTRAVEAPDDAGVLRSLAVGSWKLGEPLLVMGRFDQALDGIRTSRDTLATMVARGLTEPGWPAQLTAELGWSGYLGMVHRRMGDVHLARGDVEAARDSFRTSLEYFERSWNATPTQSPAMQRDRARSFRGLGDALALAGRHADALDAYDRSLSMLLALSAQTGAANVWERTDEARCRLSIGRARSALGDREGALAEAGRAVELAAALSAADANSLESRHLLARCLAELARAHDAVGTPDSLDPPGSRGTEAPNAAPFPASDADGGPRPAASSDARDALERAVALLERVTAADPDHALAACDLALVLAELGETQRREALRTSDGRERMTPPAEAPADPDARREAWRRARDSFARCKAGLVELGERAARWPATLLDVSPAALRARVAARLAECDGALEAFASPASRPDHGRDGGPADPRRAPPD